MSTVPSLKLQYRPSSSCSRADRRHGGLVLHCPSSARLETSQQVRNESQWRRSIVTLPETNILTVTIQTDPKVVLSSRQNQLITIRVLRHASTCTRKSTFSPRRAHAAPLLGSAPTVAQRRPLSRLSQCARQLLRGQSVGEEKLVAKSSRVIPTRIVLTYRVDS